MIGTFDAHPAVHLPVTRPPRDARLDLLRLMALRQLEDSGPLSGTDVLNAIASLTCSFDLSSPGVSLLHDLRDAGLVSATGERPPRYAVTESGRREAERLASRCWPSIRDVLVQLNVCIGCFAPRAPQPDDPPLRRARAIA